MENRLHIKKLPHLLILLFLITESFSAWIIWQNYQKNHQVYIKKNTREFEIGLTATLHHFEEVAIAMLSETTPNTKTKTCDSAILLLTVQPDSGKLVAKKLLGDIYSKLLHRGFKGFTIINSQREVMLRMHNPGYFGDTITTLNSLLDSVDWSGNNITGFYAGGTAAGYCIALPAGNKQNDRGFVILSIDNVALQQEMKKIFPYEYVFLINKESVLQTTPYPMLTGYTFSDLSVDYFYEKSDRDLNRPGMKQYIAQSEIVLFNKINKREIEKGLIKNLPFGLNAKTSTGNSYTGLFFPVAGPDKNTVAYIISYSSDATLSDYLKDTFIILIISTLLIALVFTFILFSISTFRQLKEKNWKLAESEKQLQELNLSKDKFFSIIAHDLRNPFHGLVGLAEVLTEDFDAMPPEKARKFHQLIYDSSRQGYQLVNNLLEWTRMQTGRVSYQPEKLNLNRLIDEVTGQLDLMLGSKQITIEKDMAPALFVWSDYQMTSAIVRNLLSNAIKFSYPGHSIALKSTRTADFAQISITDTGVGMDKDTCAGLWRIEISHSSKGTAGEPGTGLGLILVHDFIERNGGTISVKSEPDKGSTFTFTLPLFKI